MNRLAPLGLLLATLAACTLNPPPEPSDPVDASPVDASPVDVMVTPDVATADLPDVVSRDALDATTSDGDATPSDGDATTSDGDATTSDTPPPMDLPDVADAPADAPCGDVASDPAHCGACDNRCELPNAMPACVAGACAVARCLDGFADCDDNPRNGCEVTLATSPLHCGRCDHACAADGGAAMVCVAGACRVTTVTCEAGRGDCDGEAANGCETNLATSVAHCGVCGRTCPAVNGAASCGGGLCQVACVAGYGDCDMNTANGCETRLDTTSDCGACGRGCALANASASCFAGSCAVRACNAGFGDCDANPANGCEARLDTTASCGACGRACAFPGAAATCAGGVCALGACTAGNGDCDGNPANGCETSLASTTNCGACGRACAPSHGTGSCEAMTCALRTCDAGFGDCNGRSADGCETSTRSDPANCGACGHACMSGEACNSGACQSTCALTVCSGACVDTSANVSHCGGCGSVCPAVAHGAPVCAAGRCGLSCASGYADCNASAGDGCEADLQGSAASCGRCGSVCAPAHATPRCAGGACQVDACASGYADCDGSASNGCEVSTQTDPFHCGGCATMCPSTTNGAASCVGGVCGVTCNAGFVLSAGACVACGGVGQPVCDGGTCSGSLTACSGRCRDTDYDRLNCGECGFRCTTRNYCDTGVCVPLDTCTPPCSPL